MCRIALVSAALLLPSSVWGASVFLNGVNIDGVKNKTFENCRVQIDGAGNIYITAKGYAVQRKSSTPPPTEVVTNPTGGPPTRKYWLVTEKAAAGMTQYDIDLFINSKWVRKFPSTEPHVVMEITKHLRTGKNKILFVAKKNLGSARLSSSPQHYFRIIVGEGQTGGRNVMISKKAIDYKRTALETKNYQDQFMLDVR